MDGGFAAANMTNEWGEAGDYGCENIACGDSEMDEKLCLACCARQGQWTSATRLARC